MPDWNDRIARRGPGISYEDLGEEVVVYEEATDEIHVLNETAALIWRSLDGDRTVEDLAGLLAEEYPDEDRETLRQDLLRLIENLDGKNLVERRPPRKGG